jgi:hypothetical protein
MDDDRLERELRRAVERFDPVPPQLVRGAVAAYAWRTIDAELAELVYDSLTTTAGVRGAEQPRLLTFQAPGLTVELQVTDLAAGSRLIGQLTPAVAAEVAVRWADRDLATTADELGRFMLDSPGSGPLRLRCQLPGQAAPVVTEWIST